MEAKQKGVSAPQTQHKGNTISLKYKVLSLLKSGLKCTAKGLNSMFDFNDARKVISLLRADGYEIQDYRNNDGTKTYFLKFDGQLNLFEKGGAV